MPFQRNLKKIVYMWWFYCETVCYTQLTLHEDTSTRFFSKLLHFGVIFTSVLNRLKHFLFTFCIVLSHSISKCIAFNAFYFLVETNSFVHIWKYKKNDILNFLFNVYNQFELINTRVIVLLQNGFIAKRVVIKKIKLQ